MRCAASRADGVAAFDAAGKSMITKTLKLLLAADAVFMSHLSEGARKVQVALLRKVAHVRGLHRTVAAAKPAT